MGGGVGVERDNIDADAYLGGNRENMKEADVSGFEI